MPDIAAAAVMVKSEEMPAGAEVVKVIVFHHVSIVTSDVDPDPDF